MKKPDRPYRLLAPGPVPVPPVVMRLMSERVLHHRTPEFVEVLHNVWARLSEVFATKQPVQILTGSGSAAMEAAVVNSLSPGDEALVVVSGKFGERWAEMCTTHGAETRRFDVEWGAELDLEKFSAALKPSVKAVFTQVSETSTATVHPVREMVELVRKRAPQAVFAVDAITAVGCMPLPMDDWDLDIVVAGSQKAFMIPAGLSFIALSERAWKAQASSRMKKYYFDLAGEKKANAKGDSQFSIPTPLIVGLHEVLAQVHKRGLPHLWRRCEALSEATRIAGEMIGLTIYSRSPSPSVTALATPGDSGKIRDWLEKERNITIMGGQDHLKGKILRVGHMGDVRNEDMVALFEGLCEALKKDFKAVKPELERQLKTAEPLFS
jgi:aspartate aminotransferase-like enzyme